MPTLTIRSPLTLLMYSTKCQDPQHDADPAPTIEFCWSLRTWPIIPGAVIAVRPIGVLKMTDEGGGDEKIVAVPIPKLTQRYADVRNYIDLSEITWRQIEHFFAHYKDLEGGKWVTFVGWGDATEAKRLITQAIDRSKSQFTLPSAGEGS